jgi:lipoate-protein ligase A
MEDVMRIIKDGSHPAAYNMALDEALLRLNNGPVFRVYSWDPSAVSIGYFQSIEEEVDLKKAEELGVDVVRRITGGGAVFHDRDGEVTYSIVLPYGHKAAMKSAKESYEILCNGIIEALKILGIKAEFAGINDVVVNGKKISGSAQTRKKWGILQHGTLLYDLKPEVMFSLLKVPNEKIRDKMIANIYERVTSIRHLGIEVKREEVEEAFIKGFSEALGEDMVPSEPTKEEMELAKRLMREKYGTKEWNFRR